MAEGRRRAGRDQRAPMERLVRIAAMLQARADRGVSGETLIRVAGFEGGADPGTQLKREIRYLEGHGWQIDNVAAVGEPAHYRMRTVDNRLRIRLTPAQLAALRRAVLLADRADLVDRLGLPGGTWPDEAAGSAAAVAAAMPVDLGVVVDAVRDRQVLRFGYKGTPRVVHPDSVRNWNGVWYLRGVEEADLDEPVVKTFVVSRMREVEVDEPGSAEALPPVRHPGLHPMSWEIDPPVDVVLAMPAQFEADVRRWLGEPVGPAERIRAEPHAGEVALTYRVTHRAALQARLIELGDRVRILAPGDVRAELITALDTARGEGA